MQQSEHQKSTLVSEKEISAINGLPVLILGALFIIASIVYLAAFSRFIAVNFSLPFMGVNIPLIIAVIIVTTLMFAGIKVLKPKEAFVFTLFGKYHGTLRGPGIFFVNPFCAAFVPSFTATTTVAEMSFGGKRISLRTKTINNDKQKINDQLGNPVIIDTVVVWRIVETAKAVFNVENCAEYLSVQCNSSLRNIVSMYPYDRPKEADTDEKTLRGSTQEIALRLKEEIQSKVEIAGLEILEARITNLSYAPEIAVAMLQRQQAAAVIDAKQTIVEGAVDIVRMALHRLNEDGIVNLDEERKAAMVSNLLVVLCSNKDAQPVVNSGSLY